MSWFDTSGIANLAKSALKEAQKTIDKALDIQDDEYPTNNQVTNTPISPDISDTDNFFASWGLMQSGSMSLSQTEESKEMVITKSPTKSARTNNTSASLWGSFTGSFFETPKENKLTDNSLEASKENVSVESLTEDSIDEKFRHSKLVVHETSEDGDDIRSRKSSYDDDILSKHGDNIDNSAICTKNEVLTEIVENIENLTVEDKLPPVVKRRERPNSTYYNRLSVISSESGRNSSESVEVLGSTGTGCTSTPESEMLSLGQSISTSSSAMCLKNSDSVELLPDSLTSPSSVEIISGQTNTDDEFMSPIDSEKPFLCVVQNPSAQISPESVEVIPEDEEEEEISNADDSVSYASFSESTQNTVVEQFLLKQEQTNKQTQCSIRDMNESIQSDLSLSPEKSINIFGDAITRPPSKTGMHLSLTYSTKDLSLSQTSLTQIKDASNSPKELLPSGTKDVIKSSKDLLSQMSSKELSQTKDIGNILIDTQPLGSNQSLTSLVESMNVINPSLDSEYQESSNESLDDSGTINENENTFMESSSDDTITTTDGSFYLKNMLADAMMEKSSESITLPKKKPGHALDLSHSMIASSQKRAEDMLENLSISQLDMPLRDSSPLSSESRSDLVKIESEQTSDHTSGDELETTTSSDIEIISSPNGDSSSTQSVSRQSPAKLHGFKSGDLMGKVMITKIKGHNRELSETSSHSDDSHSETEKLLKRIADMTEILEAREAKLIDISRKNMELLENNNELKRQVEVIHTKQLESVDLNQVTEEYTQRLSALERKFQQAIREKDTLKKQMDAMKQDSANRVSKTEFETLIAEKDQTIKELREEGEKLSKTQLQHSNIIKKLRAKEKENEAIIKSLKEQLSESNSETERLKRALTAKEEVERSQIEAVHQLTSKNKKLESETSSLRSQLDDAIQKLETFKTSLDAAKKELSEKKQASNELVAREQALVELENAKQLTQSQNEEIMDQLENLRIQLRRSEQEYLKKEEMLRMENRDLLHRLESADTRNEELTESASQATKPLIRQIETLQATHNLKQTNWEKLEQSLVEKLNEAKTTLTSLSENERSMREECLNLRSKVSALETKLNATMQQNDVLSTQIEQLKAEEVLKKNELQREKESLEEKLKLVNNEIKNLRLETISLSQQLSNERIALENEKRRNAELQEQSQQQSFGILQRQPSPQGSRASSPALSIGKVSLSESLGSAVWPIDDHFDCGASASGRYNSVYESVRGNSTSVLENLQSTLKQKDGELHQLQWEMNRRDNERTLLTNELAQLTAKIEDLEQQLVDHKELKEHFNELTKKYDALCQMYGEKVEETQELRLDLEDVKEMYKSQIDELLLQQKNK